MPRDSIDALIHEGMRARRQGDPEAARAAFAEAEAESRVARDSPRQALALAGGSPNINISERTWARVKDFFECEYRGKVLTKENREVDIYFVNRPHARLLEGPGAVPKAFARRYHVYFQKPAPAFPQFLSPGVTPELSVDAFHHHEISSPSVLDGQQHSRLILR